MSGGNIGELAVHIVVDEEFLPSPIWTRNGNGPNEWINVKINIRYFC